MPDRLSVWAVPAGNAAQLVIAPPKDAVCWRVLRRHGAPVAGPDDPAASLIAEDLLQADATDIMGLVNGETYHYAVFFRDAAGAWIEGAPATGVCTPAATYAGAPVDVQDLVCERLRLGLEVEVLRKAVRPHPEVGAVEVLTAPFALAEKVRFPVVSVHMDSDQPEVRAIGEIIRPDERKRGGGWDERAGWLSRVALNVVGAAQNPAERIALRRAIKRIVLANLGVFASRDLQLVEFSQRDHEDVEAYSVPLYFTLGAFSCLAPSWVSDDPGEIEAVEVSMLDRTGS